MALFNLLFTERRRVRLGKNITEEFLPPGAIEFDAVINESHGGSNEITKHPVEIGSDITDHIRRQPETLSLTGIVSNTPLIIDASETESPTRAEEAYDKLKDLKDNGTLISVLTTLRQYDSMAIESMEVTRDVSTGNIVQADLQLVEVFTAETQESDPVPVSSSPSRKKPPDTGTQPTTEAGAEETGAADSVLSSLSSSFGF